MTIDLYAHELGTLFTYGERGWCRDGAAVLRDFDGRRFLTDTYYRDMDGKLSDEQVAGAQVTFIPSEYREVNEWLAPVYPEGVVRTITRQHDSYVHHYVPVGTPDLTEADHLRHALEKAEERVREAADTLMAETRSVSRYRARLAELSAL